MHPTVFDYNSINIGDRVTIRTSKDYEVSGVVADYSINIARGFPELSILIIEDDGTRNTVYVPINNVHVYIEEYSCIKEKTQDLYVLDKAKILELIDKQPTDIANLSKSTELDMKLILKEDFPSVSRRKALTIAEELYVPIDVILLK